MSEPHRQYGAHIRKRIIFASDEWLSARREEKRKRSEAWRAKWSAVEKANDKEQP